MNSSWYASVYYFSYFLSALFSTNFSNLLIKLIHLLIKYRAPYFGAVTLGFVYGQPKREHVENIVISHSRVENISIVLHLSRTRCRGMSDP
jgi:hypothetical protein